MRRPWLGLLAIASLVGLAALLWPPISPRRSARELGEGSDIRAEPSEWTRADELEKKSVPRSRTVEDQNTGGESSRVVTVLVRTPDGSIVPSATVQALSPVQHFVVQCADPSNGEYRVRAASGLWLYAFATDIGLGVIQVPTDGSPELMLCLAPEATITGRIETQSGVPVVTGVRALPLGFPSMLQRRLVRDSVSRSDGSFLVSGLVANVEYEVVPVGAEPSILVVSGADRVRIVVEARTGIVLEGENKSPVRWSVERQTPSDPLFPRELGVGSRSGVFDGGMAFVPLPEGDWRIRFRSRDGETLRSRRFTLHDRHERVAVPRLDDPGYEVVLHNRNNFKVSVLVLSVKGDLAGRAEVDANMEARLRLRPGDYLALVAALPDRVGDVPFTVQAKPERVEITGLTPACRVYLSVETPPGVAAAGYRLQLEGQSVLRWADSEATSGWYLVQSGESLVWTWGTSWLTTSSVALVLPHLSVLYRVQSPGFRGVSGALAERTTVRLCQGDG